MAGLRLSMSRSSILFMSVAIQSPSPPKPVPSDREHPSPASRNSSMLTIQRRNESCDSRRPSLEASSPFRDAEVLPQGWTVPASMASIAVVRISGVQIDAVRNGDAASRAQHAGIQVCRSTSEAARPKPRDVQMRHSAGKPHRSVSMLSSIVCNAIVLALSGFQS